MVLGIHLGIQLVYTDIQFNVYQCILSVYPKLPSNALNTCGLGVKCMLYALMCLSEYSLCFIFFIIKT